MSELTHECKDCGLRYMVVFANDALGHWETGFCPRCGSEDVSVSEEQEEENPNDP